jgi:hypothetical protein
LRLEDFGISKFIGTLVSKLIKISVSKNYRDPNYYSFCISFCLNTNLPSRVSCLMFGKQEQRLSMLFKWHVEASDDNLDDIVNFSVIESVINSSLNS